MEKFLCSFKARLSTCDFLVLTVIPEIIMKIMMYSRSKGTEITDNNMQTRKKAC